MLRRVFLASGLAGVLAVTPLAFGAIGSQSASPCSCCEACVCEDCRCDEDGCSCREGDKCVCSDECCSVCCSR